MSIDYRVGDSREVIAGIPDGTVDLIASSPPFLALRSYLPVDHASKGAEIGSEASPAAFLDTLLALTAEWGRVLAPHGSIAIELGDTYSGSGGAGGDYNEGGLRGGEPKADGSGRRQRAADVAAGILAPTNRPGPEGRDKIPGWALAKSLALIPQLYAVALAYGINPLTGQPSPAGRWRVRNVIVWHRPNPAVGALGDKFRPSTSYIVVATRSAKRWFDLTAVRKGEENVLDTTSRGANGVKLTDQPRSLGGGKYANRVPSAPGGAPPLDCWFDEHDTWTLTTQPSSLAHYAMWPAKLAERLILSMCPIEVCNLCGEPRRRIEHTTNALGEAAGRRSWRQDPSGIGAGHSGAITRSISSAPTAERETTGWTDCGHDQYRPGVVLDPFAGTGTTLAVADIHHRDAIGIDIDARNHALTPPRYDEVKKALFGTPIPNPAQLDIFGGIPA